MRVCACVSVSDAGSLTVAKEIHSLVDIYSISIYLLEYGVSESFAS